MFNRDFNRLYIIRHGIIVIPKIFSEMTLTLGRYSVEE